MARLTIAVDDGILQRARIRAIEQGTSVKAILRDYLASYAAGDDAGIALTEFHDLVEKLEVKSPAWWTRDELHDRPVPRES